MKRYVTIKCYPCGGTGEIESDQWRDLHWGNTIIRSYVRSKLLDCDLCGGTGERTVEDRRSQRHIARERALETPGAPVPGTGKYNHHRRFWKMKPYSRPRKGGGSSNGSHDPSRH